MKSASAQHVTCLWKQVMSKQLDVRGQRADLDGLISHGHIHSGDAGYMCQKCFYAYEKIATGLEMAESKAINALDACVLVTSEHSEALCHSSVQETAKNATHLCNTS